MIVIGSALGNSGKFSGPGGRPGGSGEGTLSVANDIVKTQSNTKGLSKGAHTVVVGSLTVEYNNASAYSGYTTVYAASTATIN